MEFIRRVQNKLFLLLNIFVKLVKMLNLIREKFKINIEELSKKRMKSA